MENRIQELKNELRKVMTLDTIFVCIGTMNSTLDSLGPRIGGILTEAGIPVCGTPKNPYHAVSYSEQNKFLDKYYKHSNKIAIDACCCTEEYKLYKIKFSQSPIAPGAGVGKIIPPVGDYAIRAYLTTKSETPLIIDSNLRLSGMYKTKIKHLDDLTNIISRAIIEVYRELQEWPQIERLDSKEVVERYV